MHVCPQRQEVLLLRFAGLKHESRFDPILFIQFRGTALVAALSFQLAQDLLPDIYEVHTLSRAVVWQIDLLWNFIRKFLDSILKLLLLLKL